MAGGSVLIGKSRRLTLDELSSLSRSEARAEFQSSDDETGGGGDDDSAGLDVGAGLAGLSLDDAELLSPGATRAALALLALTLSQGRVVRGDCAQSLAEKLVDAANADGIRLPADSPGLVSAVNSVMEGSVLEDKPYVSRAVSLARLGVVLAQGECHTR